MTTLVPLGEVCDIQSGGTPLRSRADYYGGDISWAKISDIEAADGTIYATEETITRAGLRAIRGRLFPKGTLLFAMYGSIGKMAFAGRDLATNQAILGITVLDSERVSARFIYYWLAANKALLLSQGQGITQKNLSATFLRELIIPLPPIEEQRRIAAILDQADDLRRKRRRALEELNALPQAIFQEMFGDPIANPKAWPVCPLSDLVDRERPITYGILMPGPPLDQGVPYIRVVDMKNGGVDLTSVRVTSWDISDAYRRSLLRADDLLLSIRGHVGRLASVPASLGGANITQDTARLALTGADPLFVRECLRTSALQEWMKRHTKGGAVKGINLGDVKHIPVIAPPQTMQRQFAATVSAYEAAYINQTSSAGSLEILFASLQHRAFSENLTSLSVETMLAPV
jgi:type I restriction enzyme S subunit